MESSKLYVSIYNLLVLGTVDIDPQCSLPKKEEYDNKQRLSMVSSSTVPFAIRNMTNVRALSP